MSVVRFKFRCNILISGKIIKEMPGSLAIGTQCSRKGTCLSQLLTRRTEVLLSECGISCLNSNLTLNETSENRYPRHLL